ncbi:MAG: 6,7-dimethyl-8-ribityllumazine synthase [Candidatus Liptonbacteria bacterium]|nr:6,7-dimethyl-8-ribityllumazine synthase [Candidatus Liptonbacteria bacterium]
MRRKNKSTAKFPNASRLKVGIVASEYHGHIARGLLRGAFETLQACRVKKSNIGVLKVPGSFEVPFGCSTLLRMEKYDALVALGCIIKGETDHDVHISRAVSLALMDLSLEYGAPIGFGIINANNLAQAKARAAGENNKGKEAALAAVRLGMLQRGAAPPKESRMGF